MIDEVRGACHVGGRHRITRLARGAALRAANGERKYYLTIHPARTALRTALRTIAATIKARWVCEQAHQLLKEELGLDHFEGRSWLGLHHHALFTMPAFTFLQHHRLRTLAVRGKKNSGRRTTPPQPTLPAVRPALLAALTPPVHLRCPVCRAHITYHPRP